MRKQRINAVLPITNSSDRETANRIEAPFTLFVHFVIYSFLLCSRNSLAAVEIAAFLTLSIVLDLLNAETQMLDKLP